MTHMAAAMSEQAPHPGVQLAPLTDATRKQYGLNAKLTGALVASVEQVLRGTRSRHCARRCHHRGTGSTTGHVT